MAGTVVRDLEAAIANCPQKVESLGISKCIDRTMKYYGMFWNSPRGSTFSYLMTDEAYYEQQPNEKMALPPAEVSAFRIRYASRQSF